VAAGRVGRRAPAVVINHDLERVVAVPEKHPRGGARPGVLDGVGQRLLHDPVHGELTAQGQLDGQAGGADLPDQLHQPRHAGLRHVPVGLVLGPHHVVHLPGDPGASGGNRPAAAAGVPATLSRKRCRSARP
jgi:hypothetical protein